MASRRLCVAFVRLSRNRSAAINSASRNLLSAGQSRTVSARSKLTVGKGCLRFVIVLHEVLLA